MYVSKNFADRKPKKRSRDTCRPTGRKAEEWRARTPLPLKLSMSWPGANLIHVNFVNQFSRTMDILAYKYLIHVSAPALLKFCQKMWFWKRGAGNSGQLYRVSRDNCPRLYYVGEYGIQTNVWRYSCWCILQCLCAKLLKKPLMYWEWPEIRRPVHVVRSS